MTRRTADTPLTLELNWEGEERRRAEGGGAPTTYNAAPGENGLDLTQCQELIIALPGCDINRTQPRTFESALLNISEEAEWGAEPGRGGGCTEHAACC